jgi:arylsulfatase A-like enzyme
MVSQIDLYPTLCELLHIESPAWLQGKSLLPLVSGEETEINEEIFGEVTYHSAYEPQRAIRTRRWKLIKRFDPEWPRRVGPNCDDGESKTLLSRQGWLEQKLPAVQLYDLLFDPCEANNLANHPEHAEMREELEKKLDNWMHRTDDPLLNGPVPLPDKAVMYPVDIPSYEGHAAGRNKFSA